MELSERTIQILEAEGYTTIDEQQYAPDTTLPAVISPGRTAIVVTDGEITVSYLDIVRTLTTLNRITIPARVPYSISTGSAGCRLVVAEMNAD